jgi:Rrf2 family nitric oxide-sensitive transcriptional repressor
VRLTSFTDYSLRVLIYLAADPTRRATIAEVAAAFDVSESHLIKVVHFLGKQGWLANVRGRGGGISLGLVPEQIGVGEVVRATEGAAMPAECFGPGPSSCAIVSACRLHRVLEEAVESFYRSLDRYTLADLVKNSAALTRILFIAPRAKPNDHVR